jgi:hypothetical protein
MTAPHHSYDKHLDEPTLDTRSAMGRAEYSWLAGSLVMIGFIAAISGYGQYKATTALGPSQVTTTGAASAASPHPSTPNPPLSTTGMGGTR